MFGDFKYCRSFIRGAILEFATWHWLFFINIPIAIIAIILVLITFHFPDEENVNKTNFDVKGLTVFYIFIALLMFGLLNQGHISLNTISIILAMIVNPFFTSCRI